MHTLIKTCYKTHRTGIEAKFRPFVDALVEGAGVGEVVTGWEWGRKNYNKI